MISTKIRKKGISAVIGTAIALSIVFMIIVPLFLYMQSLQSMFMQEASRRLQYELERLNERLEIYISLSKDLDSYGRRQLYLIAHNPGVLAVEIPAIYLESRIEGLKRMELSSIGEGGYLTISPGQKLVKRLEFYFLPSTDINDEVRVKVISRRGNSFISENSIGPTKLPYMLIVAVENLTIGYRYKIEVEVSDRDMYGNVNEYGCVLSAVPPGGDGVSSCKTLDEYVLIPQTPSGNEGIAFFMVAPGSYIVRLKVEDSSGNESILSSYGPLEILDNTVVRIIGPGLPTPQKIPLKIQTPYSNTISMLDVGDYTIPYIVSLGNQSEPLRKVKITVTVDCTGLQCNVLGIDGGGGANNELVLTRIHPGESYVGCIKLGIQDIDGKPGGRVMFEIKVVEATGEFSRKLYTTDDFELPTAKGTVTLCRLSRINNVMLIQCEVD